MTSHVRLPRPAAILVQLATLVAAGFFFGAVASDAAEAAPRVDILTPKDGSHPGKRKMVAKVRVKGNDFRAFLNGRNVTRRFKKAGRNSRVRKAVFVRGRDYRVGEGDLFAMVGKGYRPKSDQHFFTATKRQDGLMRVRRVGKPAYELPRFHVRSKHRLRGSKVWLNGKNVRRHFDLHDDLRGIFGQPGGATSLRHGRNKLVVRVFQKNGRYATKTMRFRVPPTRPIASAGPDRRVGVGDRVTLDSRKSRKPKRGKKAGGPLKTSWKVVGAPIGSRAKADRPNSARTTFTPDESGTYRLQAVVRSAGGVRSVDEMKVNVPQVVTPMGMPIQTITDSGGIQIGNPDQAGADGYPKLGNWVQMVVIDPDTATHMAGPWDNAKGSVHSVDPATGKTIKGVLGFNQGQGSALLNAVKMTKFQQMVVLTGQGASVTLSKSDQQNLGKAINYLGGTVAANGPTPQGTADLANGQWSVIGHDGLTEGQAFQNYFAAQQPIDGFLGGSAGQRGSLNGYLQSGMNSVGYQFVQTDTVAIDTKWTPNLSTAPPLNQNTIEVGGEKYASGRIDDGSVDHCPCAVAIQVLVLDPGTLAQVDGGTYGVLKTDGSTNFNGIYSLAQKLNEYVNDHGTGASKVIIVQDFGKYEGESWPGNSSDWIQDSLPDNSYTPEWQASHFPKGSQLFQLWNQGGPHGFGTVAGNLGKLAGYEVHDIVANYRRPVYDTTQDKTVPRNWGGLTVVAATNLYQWSDAYAKGQGDIAPASTDDPLLNTGRVTGALRRNEQSQWEMTGATRGAGYPGAINSDDPNSADNSFESAEFSQLVYAPEVAWPCSEEYPPPCLGTPAEVAASLKYISNLLQLAGSPDDVRDRYLVDTISWTDVREDMGQIPCSGVPGISEPVCNEMKAMLSGEMEDLDQVKLGFDTLQGILDGTNKGVDLNLKNVGKKVTSAVVKAHKDLLKEESSADVAGPLAEALYVASETFELALTAGIAPESLEFAPAELGLTASVIDLGMELFPFFDRAAPTGGDQVKNDTDAIEDRVSNLAQDMDYQLIATDGTLKHFHDLVRTDPIKLHTMSLNFGAKWSLDTKNEQRLGQSIAIGASRSLYDSIMPIAFTQWMISPRNTTLNTSGVLDLPDRGYNCSYLDGDYNYAGLNHPLQNMPSSMSGMTSVAWAANYAPNGQGHTVRALKLRDDDMRVINGQDPAQYGDNFLEHKGGTTPAALLDPLFSPPSDLVSPSLPNSLGMTKDEFFGQAGWDVKKLQCGFAND